MNRKEFLFALLAIPLTFGRQDSKRKTILMSHEYPTGRIENKRIANTHIIFDIEGRDCTISGCDFKNVTIARMTNGWLTVINTTWNNMEIMDNVRPAIRWDNG